MITLELLRDVGVEYQNAIEKHGARYASVLEGLEVLREELEEAQIAAQRNDIDGPHGVKREVRQVAAVCFKLLEGLRDV